NKRCSHCYQDNNGKNELPLSELEHILRIMEDALLKWDRVCSLSLTGGEPFIRTQELFSLMDQIDQSGRFAFYDILTNGSMLHFCLTAGSNPKRR
ncbi:4Fe-4S cluster-binding domain-containing protein, partial [Chloroflexota bacterium]